MELKDHPAKYSESLIPVMAELITRFGPTGGRLLDPMAGTGRASHVAEMAGYSYAGIEIEPEWAAHHKDTIVGDATALPFSDSSFSAICVSPAYGNRMADAYAGSPKDFEHVANGGKRPKRLTYRIHLERPLNANSGAGMQWGKKYRDLHEQAWAESVRVLRPGGVFLLNNKNHQRAGTEVLVTEWHCEVLSRLGLERLTTHTVETPHYGQGANSQARYPETLVVFRHP